MNLEAKTIPHSNNLLKPVVHKKFVTPVKPTISNKDSFHRVNADWVNRVRQEIENGETLLFDCRYPYEYEVGHIPHAKNCHNPEEMLSFLFDQTRYSRKIIFHCEFSSKRGPDMYPSLI
eukprot:NODE_254_length_11700_cov_0.671580.p13 type:complete len:119 gc:universal NODE_254_length_11700_cov_0.671580:5155-4799(-)